MRLMLKFKYVIIALSMVAFVNAMGSENRAGAEQQDESLILRKAQKVNLLIMR